MHDKLKSKDNNITTKDYVTGEKELKGTYKIDGKEYGFTIDDMLNVKLGDIEQTIEEAFDMTVTNVDKTSLRVTGNETKLNELGATEYTYVASTSTGDIKYEHITTTSYDVTGLEPDTEYTVYMLAYDNAGNVKKSNEVTVTTKKLEIVTTDAYIGTSKTETDATKSATDRSQKKGDSLYINFNATLEGINCKIALKGDPTLITLPYEVTTNGKITFVATGTYSGKTVTKEIEVTVEKFKIYEIYTPQDLQDMSKDRFGDYIIMNDIDMTGFDFKTISYGNSKYFEGTIDGQGHTISNLKSSIFSTVNNVQIKNLLLKDVDITAEGGHVAVLAQYNYGTDTYIEKVGITGSANMILKDGSTGGRLGSFFGISYNNTNITFKNCYSRINLNKEEKNYSYVYDVGGFVGRSKNINIQNCYWAGKHNGTNRTGSFTGGPGIENNNNQYTKGITVTNSFYNKDLFTISVPEKSSGKGLTTEEMKQQSSYIGWDFTNDWYMGPDGYPELKF